MKTYIHQIISGDDFHSKALKIYLDRFSFKGDPLDIAVRRLLMDLALPRETQQIDRVMEAFSARYNECNPGLFAQNGKSTCDTSNLYLTASRSSLRIGVQLDHASHGRFQQVQQIKNDKGLLYQEYSSTRRVSRGPRRKLIYEINGFRLRPFIVFLR